MTLTYLPTHFTFLMVIGNLKILNIDWKNKFLIISRIILYLSLFCYPWNNYFDSSRTPHPERFSDHGQPDLNSTAVCWSLAAIFQVFPLLPSRPPHVFFFPSYMHYVFYSNVMLTLFFAFISHCFSYFSCEKN